VDTDRTRKATYPEKREAARNSLLGISLIDPPTKTTLEVSSEEREERFEEMWHQGSNQGMLLSFTDLMRSQEANDLAADFARRKIRTIVEDAEVAELLCPQDYPIGAKRLCVGTNYYETFNRPNVTLVDALTAPIEEITSDGIRSGGTHYAVDTILFATGFDAMTGALREIDIRGRHGVALRDRWVAGPTTYLGIMVAGLPNLFIITGPGSPSVKSNMILSIEQHVDWIAECLTFLRARHLEVIEPTAEAETAWVAHVNEIANATLYVKADSWYTGANVPGKPRVFMPYVGGISVYRGICDDVAADGYRGFQLTRAGEAAATVSAAGPGAG
jgi:cyclohexanone monooxygenase